MALAQGPPVDEIKEVAVRGAFEFEFGLRSNPITCGHDQAQP